MPRRPRHAVIGPRSARHPEGAAPGQEASSVKGSRRVRYGLAERRRRVPPLYRMNRDARHRETDGGRTAGAARAPRGSRVGTVENRWSSDAARDSARPARRYETGRDRHTRHTRHRGPEPRAGRRTGPSDARTQRETVARELPRPTEERARRAAETTRGVRLEGPGRRQTRKRRRRAGARRRRPGRRKETRGS